MRTIYLLRGAPASGKSTWIRDNKLEPYTLSADSIRLMVQSPILNLKGDLTITQENDAKVWDLLFNMLENKMNRGEFCIVDATHYKRELLKRYKDLISQYRYRAFIVDFTQVPLEVLKERNLKRDIYKRVPEEAIEKMCSVFKAEQVEQIPGFIKKLTPEEALDKIKEDPVFDFNKYEKIVVIPDLHGSYYPLEKYFNDNPFNDNYFYCFLGDYLDRNTQNKEVLEFLFTMMDKRNVLLLEGNHERWLRKYSAKNPLECPTQEEFKTLGKYISKVTVAEIRKNFKYSHDFKDKTIPQIENIDKSQIRHLCEKLGQLAYFKFGDKVYCLTHGGLANKPNLLISTKEFINGTGGYGEIEEVYKSWTNNTPDNYIQLHGHRNILGIDAKVNDKNYNLNSSVEYGEDLRVAEITKEQGVIIKYVPNLVFVKREEKQEEKQEVLHIQTQDELYKSLNESTIVNKKLLDNNIVSYNFNRKAFNKGIWNHVTVKARGLFINSKTQNVTARSYNKFFNINEEPETEIRNLKSNLKFPLTAYRKENGFLGLVSWDKDNDALFTASKSTNVGDFADIVREQFNSLTHRDRIIEFLKGNNYTLVFEVIDVVKDPHIIQYPNNKMVLLDCIENSLQEFKKLPYNELCQFAMDWRVDYKLKDYTFNNWEEFFRFYTNIQKNMRVHLEGWVFEDSVGFMFKYKTPYYKFWKYMRSMKDAIVKGHLVRQTFKDSLEVKVLNFIRSMDKEKLAQMSIIDVRNEYLKQYEGTWEPQEE